MIDYFILEKKRRKKQIPTKKIIYSSSNSTSTGKPYIVYTVGYGMYMYFRNEHVKESEETN